MTLPRATFLISCLMALAAACASKDVLARQDDPAKMLNDAEALMGAKNQPVDAEKLIIAARAIYQRENDAQGLGLAYRAYGDLLRSATVTKWEQHYRHRGFLDRSVTFDNRLSRATDFYIRALQNFDVASTQYLAAARYDRLTNVYFNRAWSHAGLGETDKACADFDRALEAHTQYSHINPTGQVSFPARFKSMAEAMAYAKHLAGCPNSSATHIVSLRPAQDFPTAESFYPRESRASGEEGKVTVNVCVDTKGELSGEPSVVHSSGSANLDAAAIELAKAGSGHYLAPTENDVPQAGCGTFAIAFTLRGDAPVFSRAYPNPFSTLALRKSTLDEQFEQRMLERTKSSRDIVLQPQKFTVGDPDSVNFLRSQAAALAQLEVELNGATSDYIAGMDQLESAGDVSDEDRRAFRSEWRPIRRDLLDRISQLTSSAAALSEIVDEFGDYYETGPRNPTPRQRTELEAMAQRGRQATQDYAAALKRLMDPRADMETPLPPLPGRPESRAAMPDKNPSE